MVNKEEKMWDYNASSENEKKIFRDWIKGVLQNETAELTFRKKDGTLRTMKASLRSDDIPEVEKKTDRVKKSNDEALSVIDLELNEWRSFRYDSVVEIKFTLEK